MVSLDGSIIDLPVTMFDWAKYRRREISSSARRPCLPLNSVRPSTTIWGGYGPSMPKRQASLLAQSGGVRSEYGSRQPSLFQ